MKDVEDEKDEGAGDWMNQDRFVNCCVGDRAGDDGCGGGDDLTRDGLDLLMWLKLVKFKVSV